MKSFESVSKSFLLHCRIEKNLSVKSVEAYSSDIEQFMKYLNRIRAPKEDIKLLDKTIIRGFIQDISNFKPKTVKRKIATLKALFNFLEYEEIILVNPFRKMKINIKEPYVLPRTMSIDEVKIILKTMYKEVASNINDTNSFHYNSIIRDITIIEVLFATGIRVSELCNLKITDIDFSKFQIIINGKGNKERIIQVCNSESVAIMKKYYSLFEKNITSTGYFFINRLGKPISEQSVRFMIKRYASLAGFEKSITPHTFRHTFATLLLEENVDIKYIQHLLGHSSIVTTQIYTHVNRKKQEQILSQFHPRNGFHFDTMNAG